MKLLQSFRDLGDRTTVSLIFMAEAEKAYREILNESDILCYKVITLVIHLSESGKLNESSYLNLDW